MDKLSLLYASALYDLAVSNDAVGEFLDQAVLLRDSLQDPDCQRILVHPHITTAEKRDFFTKAFGADIHKDLLAFMFLVVDKNRETFMLSALEALISMIERSMKKVTADVYFAAAINEKQLAAMKDLLSEKLSKQVEVSVKVDPSVIGGPYIFVDGYYLDWTVKKRLRDLTVQMKEGCSA